MIRKWTPLLAATVVLVVGCAGPARLAQRSEEKLAGGDMWRAWQLATRALDKAPGNPQARAAATAAGAAIAEDWERRIHALAALDSLQSAEQVLAFTDFRAQAARYATVPVSAGWPAHERALRQSAARAHYAAGATALQSKRPKRAWLAFLEVDRFVPGYRDAARLSDRAFEKALTRVAVVPFRSAGDPELALQVTDSWRGDLVENLAPPNAHFTRVLAGDEVTRAMSVSQLGHVTRAEAVTLGRKAGAQRVVWGSIGAVKSSTRLQFFRDVVARRITVKDADGRAVTRWVDVPIEVIARVRDVTVPVEYEVIATRDGATLARQRSERSGSARVVWTSYQPEGEVGSYALVAETVRSAHPERARAIESRWKDVCGAEVTLGQVLEARVRTAHEGGGRWSREALPRLVAGAAFLFLEELPPASDLAYAALVRGGSPLREDLARLDAVDDVDLGVSVAGPDAR